jgi:hypothetical protein
MDINMKRLTLRLFILLTLTVLIAACFSPEVGSDAWCEAMDKKPKSEWSLDDTASYTKHCVLGVGTVVGSEAWCKKMDDKPKGDWSSNEAADYAKHCVF